MPSLKSLVAAIALIGAIAPAHAETWPTRPVKFIVPFGPGAGADIVRGCSPKSSPKNGASRW
jgi:tripartite-type tricarboxylate transporter receptor subunit TctC